MVMSRRCLSRANVSRRLVVPGWPDTNTKSPSLGPQFGKVAADIRVRAAAHVAPNPTGHVESAAVHSACQVVHARIPVNLARVSDDARVVKRRGVYGRGFDTVNASRDRETPIPGLLQTSWPQDQVFRVTRPINTIGTIVSWCRLNPVRSLVPTRSSRARRTARAFWLESLWRLGN